MLKPEYNPAALSELEMWRLRISCNYIDGNYAGVDANRWWLALHCVLWSTGEQIGMVLKLKFSEIQGDKIIFLPDAWRGRTEANVCFVPPYVLEAIELIRQPTRARVFIWPFTMNYLYHTSTKILRRAELDLGHATPRFGIGSGESNGNGAASKGGA